MPDLASKLPKALARQAVFTTLCQDQIEFEGHRGVPVLLAHPDEGWNDSSAPAATARPVVIWMHGRSVNKELDPGRYRRWLRAPGGGIASCAIDLPGHGERFIESCQGPERALEVIKQAASEIDCVIDALASDTFRGAFDLSRVAIGGMSAGGMTTLHRLASEHTFTCACVEATAGDFSIMRDHDAFVTCGGRDPDCTLANTIDPVQHLNDWRPIPLLALHSEADRWVPAASMHSFIAKLREHYTAEAADPSLVELHTWPETGAPQEHAGFGRFANDAKNLQTKFLVKHLIG